MNLPRSVKEMSVDLNPPRRCKSDLFKGFSFIQDGFVLPERPDTDKDFYWNNIEEDGESASECASTLSKTEGDGGYAHHESTTSENFQDKMKNRKKKKNLLSPAPATNQSSTDPKINSFIDATLVQVAVHSDAPIAISTKDSNLDASLQKLDQPNDAPIAKSTIEKEMSSPKVITMISDMQKPSTNAENKQKEENIVNNDNSETYTEEWETVVKPSKKSGPRDIARPTSKQNDHGRASMPLNSISQTKEGSFIRVDRDQRPLINVGTPNIRVEGNRRPAVYLAGQPSNDWRDHKMRTPNKVVQSSSDSSPADATSWPALSEDRSQIQSTNRVASNFSPKGAWASRAPIK